MTKHMHDYEPYSKMRMARILEIYEAAYRYRRMPADKQTREQIYVYEKQYNMDTSEVLLFIDCITNRSFKEIRKYMVEHNSTIIRIGKKTRPRRVKK